VAPVFLLVQNQRISLEFVWKQIPNIPNQRIRRIKFQTFHC
jgi:hypothetical protein